MTPTPNEAPEFMTPAQFGWQIGASRATVYRYIAEGILHPVHMPNAATNKKDGKRGSRVRLTRDELARFKASLTDGAA